MRVLSRSLTLFLMPAALLCAPVMADDAELPVKNCADAVGTFLMSERQTDGDAKSRSLMALTNGGHVMFIGSDEESETGYAPFADGLGRWRCLSKEGEKPKLRAVILNFTYPAEGDQKIGRIDLDGTVDPGSGVFKAKATLSFFPLDANPMKDKPEERGGKFDVTGRKVEAPK